MTPFALGSHLLRTFWTLGLRAAQKVCTKPAQGSPWYGQKGVKMEPQSEQKLEHNVRKNIQSFKKQNKETTTKQKDKV